MLASPARLLSWLPSTLSWLRPVSGASGSKLLMQLPLASSCRRLLILDSSPSCEHRQQEKAELSNTCHCKLWTACDALIATQKHGCCLVA